MKKSLRIASILLVLVLVTSCFVGGTFAKYITDSSDATDTARVAKWGVDFTVKNDTLFEKTYATDDTNYKATITSSVASSNEDNVVAPGTTEQDFLDFVVTGTPEVAFKVDYTAILTLEGWEVNNDEYCPIIFTVEDVDYYVGKEGIADVAALKTAVEGAIAACSNAYAPNATVAAADAPTVSWRWEFEGDDDDATSPIQTDDKDTALGDAAADGNAATIKLVVSATATQID